MALCLVVFFCSLGCAGSTTVKTTGGVSQSADGGSGVESDADYQAVKRVVDEEAAYLRALIGELKAAAGDPARLAELKKAHHARSSAIERTSAGTWDLS